MISIKKGKAPAILATGEGYEKSEQVKKKFDNGERKFSFDSKVYGHTSVKTALKKAQHDKCCFCEAKVTHVAHGDIEHFRPKGGWQQKEKDKISQVGYYWLAYDWDNLLFSCQICNQTYKKNYFPLENPTDRAIDHHSKIENENPLIINPALDNPAEHLEFKKEFVKAKTLKGTETIKCTGIDRSTLDDSRRVVMSTIKNQLDLLALLDSGQVQSPTAQDVIVSLQELVSPKMPFFAMLRDNFRTELTKFGIDVLS